mmetsp:Transcript_21855/g.60687  ORF Transcript_21855/g.60687 Transcript_21855/m.60687 type:complete len:217 (+) Transcript_21855:222-872(+)
MGGCMLINALEPSSTWRLPKGRVDSSDQFSVWSSSSEFKQHPIRAPRACRTLAVGGAAMYGRQLEVRIANQPLTTAFRVRPPWSRGVWSIYAVPRSLALESRGNVGPWDRGLSWPILRGWTFHFGSQRTQSDSVRVFALELRWVELRSAIHLRLQLVQPGLRVTVLLRKLLFLLSFHSLLLRFVKRLSCGGILKTPFAGHLVHLCLQLCAPFVIFH